MRRSRRLLLAGVALAVIAAVGGSLVAMGLGDDNGATPKPTGTRTVLRIQPVDDTVSCGPGGAAAYIYLDDLEFRPSPNDATVAYGVAGWQLALEYDPTVLRIANATDIELNPRLSEEDADGDGIARSFFPVANLNDAGGLALVGGASVVPSGGDLRDEEGLDPVAKGEPLLLSTVRFQTVGQGSTTLTLGNEAAVPHPALAPGLVDTAGEEYDPVVFTDATITVEGGDCPDVVLNTPLPTRAPSSTPYIEPTWTPVPWRTVEPIDAPSAGRNDCPEGWVAYTDPQDRFSICYPAEFGATASDFALNVHSPEAFDGGGTTVTVVASWSASSGYGLGPPSPDTCARYTDIVEGSPVSSEFVTLSFGDRTGLACLTVGRIQSSLHGIVPMAADGTGKDGYVQFRVAFTADDLAKVPRGAEAILPTLRVGP